MPTASIVHRIETFRDIYNIARTLHPDPAASGSADPLDTKLVQYLLSAWATQPGLPGAKSTNRAEACRIVMGDGFINGLYAGPTLRVMQLFETDFGLRGDGIVEPIPARKTSSPIHVMRHKLGMLNCQFLYQVNRSASSKPFDEIRRELLRGMPRDLGESLYPNLLSGRRRVRTSTLTL